MIANQLRIPSEFITDLIIDCKIKTNSIRIDNWFQLEVPNTGRMAKIPPKPLDPLSN